jgi:hypothetical protein
MMAVGNVVIHVCLQCLVKLKIKVKHLLFNGGCSECGYSFMSAMSGETDNESIAFNVQ